MTSAAIIGSFRQHYEEVLDAVSQLRAAGVIVRSPVGSDVIDPNRLFVRFESDNELLSDDEVQSVALHRILGADVVYAICPNGYIGRTTCYEVGRVLGSRTPLYFSAQPHDLPIEVARSHIVTLPKFIEIAKSGRLRPMAHDSNLAVELEAALDEREFRNI